MPKFRFKAKNLDNKIIKGILVAKNVDELREIISHYDYFLLWSKKIPESSQLFTFLEKIKIDDLTSFCRQFAVMISSGIEIIDSISSLRDNTKNAKLKSILTDCHRRMMEGSSLSASFAKYPKTFPPFFTNMLLIGEASGNMDYVLNRLADYYEKDAKTKKKIKASMTYPKLLLLMGIAVVLVLSVFVMPIFSDLFGNFDADLPEITVIVNKITTFIRSNIGLIIIAAMVLVIGLSIFKQTKLGTRVIDRVRLSIPVLRYVTIATITARFANGFGVLIDSGAKIVDSLDIIGRLLGNTVVEDLFKIATSEIKRGQPIAKSLQTIDIFPNMLIEMIRVGESSDSIDKVLKRTGDYFDEQVNVTIQKMTTFIEPLFMLAIGGIVAVILLSVFLPMMSLMDAISADVG
ncbi:MAG: type II secretion system F family protein [Candidatus Izemoplasmatales bacterium]|nr:type II secretion system F family protein [Candidatus Izemoplasmatales bacterium]MDD5293036.1 type II secretion system F family protein [Candidatus Izemoplasmatales bacterium]